MLFTVNISFQQLANVFLAMAAHFDQPLTCHVFGLCVINWCLYCLLTIRSYKSSRRQRKSGGKKKKNTKWKMVTWDSGHIMAHRIYYADVLFSLKNVPSVYILHLPKLF